MVQYGWVTAVGSKPLSKGKDPVAVVEFAGVEYLNNGTSSHFLC